jgi:fibronectin type 3 domain-containing protein
VYTYRVYAIDIDGNRSNEAAMATIGTEKNLPIAPFALQAMAVDEGVYLTWATVIFSGIQSIKLYRYERGQPASLIASLPADAEEYMDEGAGQDTVYFYYLTTINQEGLESAASEEVGVVR